MVESCTPLWIAARLLLYERGDDFFKRRDKVLKTYDPEDIHDLRVSSRRMREGLELFAPCYPPKAFDTLLKLAKRVTRLLGEVRNIDEGILFFTSLSGELGGDCSNDLQTVMASFRNSRDKELKKLKAGLRKTAGVPWQEQYRRAVNSPALFSPTTEGVDLFASLTVFAEGAFDSKASEVAQLARQAMQQDAIEAQHNLRIAIKHLRYRIEMLSVLYGENFPGLHKIVKGYQDALGTMHDLDVFAAIIRSRGLSELTEQLALAHIKTKRQRLFEEFRAMMEDTPLPESELKMRTTR